MTGLQMYGKPSEDKLLHDPWLSGLSVSAASYAPGLVKHNHGNLHQPSQSDTPTATGLAAHGTPFEHLSYLLLSDICLSLLMMISESQWPLLLSSAACSAPNGLITSCTQALQCELGPRLSTLSSN